MQIILGSDIHIASIISINNEVQKLRQKSQLNSWDISFGALSMMCSRNPILSINRMVKADAKTEYSKQYKIVINDIVDIILLLLM